MRTQKIESLIRLKRNDNYQLQIEVQWAYNCKYDSDILTLFRSSNAYTVVRVHFLCSFVIEKIGVYALVDKQNKNTNSKRLKNKPWITAPAIFFRLGNFDVKLTFRVPMNLFLAQHSHYFETLHEALTFTFKRGKLFHILKEIKYITFFIIYLFSDKYFFLTKPIVFWCYFYYHCLLFCRWWYLFEQIFIAYSKIITMVFIQRWHYRSASQNIRYFYIGTYYLPFLFSLKLERYKYYYIYVHTYLIFQSILYIFSKAIKLPMILFEFLVSIPS